MDVRSLIIASGICLATVAFGQSKEAKKNYGFGGPGGIRATGPISGPIPLAEPREGVTYSPRPLSESSGLSNFGNNTPAPLAPDTGVVQTSRPECIIDQAFKTDARGNAGCLIIVENKMLVLEHNKNHLLGVPGGHAEGNELAQCTAGREVWEETGLTVTVGKLLNTFPNNFYLFECTPNVKLTLNEKLKVPSSGTNEITAIHYVDPRGVKKSKWRFAKQKNWYHDYFNKRFQGSNVHH